MIISRTPLRISFFGGTTDFPEYYLKHGGAVLGTAIDKYIYHFVTRFPSKLFDYSIRLAYSKVERVKTLDEIEHAPFREILKMQGIGKDIEISLAADLPSFSGLGSSSSFTVGLLNALGAFQGNFTSQQDLAKNAIHVERNVLKEVVGCQDQVFAAYGGFNVIEFSKSACEFNVQRLPLSAARMDQLGSSLLLFFTGITRKAQEVEKSKLSTIETGLEQFKSLRLLVDESYSILTGNNALSSFGELLDKTWQAKKRLSSQVSNEQIDKIYDLAKGAGALGGKLLGAGGGGFMLLYVPEENQSKVRSVLKDYYEIPFKMNAPGSSIIHSA